jgi:hypothetical protein
VDVLVTVCRSASTERERERERENGIPGELRSGRRIRCGDRAHPPIDDVGDNDDNDSRLLPHPTGRGAERARNIGEATCTDHRLERHAAANAIPIYHPPSTRRAHGPGWHLRQVRPQARPARPVPALPALSPRRRRVEAEPGQGHLPGSFTVSEDRIEFFNDPHCYKDVGVYAWRLKAGALTLEVVEDGCGAGLRARNLVSLPWESCQPPSMEAAITDHWSIPIGCDTPQTTPEE